MTLRLFVYEYLSAGGWAGQPGGDSFRVEGRAMLAAVRADLDQVAGVETVTLLTPDGAEQAAFRDRARQADYTLVIAPETDGILETRCRWVREVGGRLLGPSPEAVRLTADKLQLARHWQERGIPTEPVLPCCSPPAARNYPLVLKPRHGAGSQATFLAASPEDWLPSLSSARQECPSDDLLWQRLVPGSAASVAFLIGPRNQLPLLPATQRLSQDGRFSYRGGELPLPSPLAERAVGLARRALDGIPGLLGYVGVDLVLGPAPDGSADRAIEINPRLTTSYVGLRRLAETNLAEAMLRLVQGETVAAFRWRPGHVHFRADGTVAGCQDAAESGQ